MTSKETSYGKKLVVVAPRRTLVFWVKRILGYDTCEWYNLIIIYNQSRN